MNILQIGAGSMGTRRLRDLSSIKHVKLALLDLREDRRQRAKKTFNIPVYKNIKNALNFKPEAIVISTPPDQHDFYIKLALENGLHHFCESSIWTYNYKEVMETSSKKGLASCPSNTMLFLPSVKKIKEIVASGQLGTIQDWHMFLSTYEPGWHPAEGKEYYARNRATSAGRDMLAFELMYLSNLFKEEIASVYASINKRGKTSGNFEDCWNILIEHEEGLTGNFTILIGSKPLMRNGWIAGQESVLKYNILTGIVEIVIDNSHSIIYKCGSQKETLEKTYLDEISSFVKAIKGEIKWPITYKHNAEITAITAAIEKSALSNKREKVDIIYQPSIRW